MSHIVKQFASYGGAIGDKNLCTSELAVKVAIELNQSAHKCVLDRIVSLFYCPFIHIHSYILSPFIASLFSAINFICK